MATHSTAQNPSGPDHTDASVQDRAARPKPDAPINDSSGDKLGRTAFADLLANDILTIASTDGFTIGIQGPWGSGKSSLLNLLANALNSTAGIIVLRFNPWLFSGTEQLVAHFFRELSAQLLEKHDGRLAAVSKTLAQYGELVSPLHNLPVVGQWARFFTSLTDKFKQKMVHDTDSALTRRTRLSQALSASDQRFVVLIDDVDRLSASEIRDILKLVRLTADLPNTVYVLAYDRIRVEQALSETEHDGRAYLEKIFQAVHDIPAIRERDLTALLLDGIHEIANPTEHGLLESEYWTDVFLFVIRPLFATPRDVRRYLNSAALTVKHVHAEVSLVDIFALEALRVLQPQSFARLLSVADALTMPASRSADNDKAGERLRAFIASGDEHASQLAELCQRVFPASRSYLDNYLFTQDSVDRWKRQRRVAHPEILRIYFEKQLPADAIPSPIVNSVMDAFTSSEGPDETVLGAIPANQLRQVLQTLSDDELAVNPNGAHRALTAILNQEDRLAGGPEGMFDLGAEVDVNTACVKILSRVPKTYSIDSILSEVYPQLRSLSARLALLRVSRIYFDRFGSTDDRSFDQQLDRRLIEELLRSSATELADEIKLGRLLMWAVAQEPEATRALIDRTIANDAVMLRIVLSAVGYRYSATVGSGTVKTSMLLDWDGLTELCGADRLKQRITELTARRDRGGFDAVANAALDLANRYLGGWRPD